MDFNYGMSADASSFSNPELLSGQKTSYRLLEVQGPGMLGGKAALRLQWTRSI
jgi:hypothetical protein